MSGDGAGIFGKDPRFDPFCAMAFQASSPVWREGVIIAIQILGVLVGLLVLLVLANVWSPRKRINHQINSHYRIDDPQLLRTMGSLMGPAILAGNRVTPLQNGDAIFPRHDSRHSAGAENHYQKAA